MLGKHCITELPHLLSSQSLTVSPLPAYGSVHWTIFELSAEMQGVCHHAHHLLLLKTRSHHAARSGLSTPPLPEC